MAELLNCPFCGAADTDGESGPGLHIMGTAPNEAGVRRWVPCCLTCGTYHSSFDTPDDALAGWNRRAPAEETP